eukprot:m.32131 g.32131  ORF g.32131 m.32131 type:complete len:205 (-) comp4862_c0_seq1:163-777(-)
MCRPTFPCSTHTPHRPCPLTHSLTHMSILPSTGKASTERSTPGGDLDDDSSDESDDSDDDSAGPMGAHAVEQSQKMEVMRLVKEGKISMQDAVARIAASDFITDLEHVAGTTPSPTQTMTNELKRRSLCDAQVPQGPYALALYDNLDTQHDEEIKFQEGDAICLTGHVDDDWLEGYVFTDPDMRVGIFPLAFVEVIVDLETETS